MPNQSPPTRYSAVAQGFHWIIAALIVVQFTLGWTAAFLPIGARKLARLDWHKSFGMTILTLAVLRLLWQQRLVTDLHRCLDGDSVLDNLARQAEGSHDVVAQLLAQISHDVFVNAFLEAMKSTLYLPVAVVLLAALVTVLLRRQAPMPAAARGEAGASADKAAA